MPSVADCAISSAWVDHSTALAMLLRAYYMAREGALDPDLAAAMLDTGARRA